MSSRHSGHRGADGDNWNWGQDPPGSDPGSGPRRGGPWGPILLLTVAGALAAAILIAILARGGGAEDGTTPSATKSRAATPLTRSPTAAPSVESTFAIWSRLNSSWGFDSLPNQPTYTEGDFVPFMVRIDRAEPGAVYDIAVRYQCQAGAIAAFDYLGGIATADEGALTTDPGPGGRPDTTLSMPDDPSLTFDNAPGRVFRIWGGTFSQPPVGPLPPSACADTKLLSLTVLARDETAYLVLGAHLASRLEWGEGKGAGALTTPITLEASLDGRAIGKVTVPPDAIALDGPR